MIEWNERGNNVITNCFVEHDFLPREMARFGKWKPVGGVELIDNLVFNLHIIRQFSDVDERYNAEGDIDLEKKINWTSGLRKLKEHQNGNDIIE